MLISAATPQELIDWFHTRQEDQRILCIMLAPTNEDQAKLAELIEDLSYADAVLGSEVAFLLLHPSANNALGLDKRFGGVLAFKGCAFPPSQSSTELAHPLRETPIFRELSSEWEPIQKSIAMESSKAMARFAPDFMNLLQVSQRELPCLCVLVKGLDESVVFPLGQGWNPTTLMTLLSGIRDIADTLPNFRVEFETLLVTIPTSVRTLEETIFAINAKTRKIVSVLKRILHRNQGTEADTTLIADFIAQKCPSTKQLEEILTRLSFSASTTDQQIPKVIKLMRKLEEFRNDTQGDLARRQYILSIADKAKQLVETRVQIFTSLQSLQVGCVTPTSATNFRLLKGIKTTLEWINLSGDAGEKVLKAAEWCFRLFDKN